MTDYPTWDHRFHYLSAAETAVAQVRADLNDDTTNVWKSIDVVIAELHKLRDAAGSEQMRRHDAAMASSAELLARPSGTRQGVTS